MNSRVCTVTELVHSSGYRTVRLENGLIAVTVIPDKGAEIYSYEYLPLGVDVLWKAPWGLRKFGGGAGAAGASSEMAWMDQYAGGWQGIFPNGGEPCFYRGAHHNFHGESSIVPWKYEVISAGEESVSLLCEVTLARSPFALRRLFRLNRDSGVLSIEESITNQCSEEMQFIWGHHPAFGAPFLSADCRLQVPARSFERDHGGGKVLWKNTGLDRVPGMDAHVSEFGYLSEFDAGWFAVCNERLGLGFALAWPVEIFPYAWFWQELGGTPGYPWYGRSYVMAIEPFTTIPALGLAHAASVNTAARLGPMSSLHIQMAAVLFQDSRAIRSCSPDGELVFV